MFDIRFSMRPSLRFDVRFVRLYLFNNKHRKSNNVQRKLNNEKRTTKIKHRKSNIENKKLNYV